MRNFYINEEPQNSVELPLPHPTKKVNTGSSAPTNLCARKLWQEVQFNSSVHPIFTDQEDTATVPFLRYVL